MTMLIASVVVFLFGVCFGVLVSDLGVDVRHHIRTRRQRKFDITNGLAVAKLLKRSVK